MSEDILDRIQAVLDGTCAHCNALLRPDGPSDIYCDDECQRRAAEQSARGVTQVQYRPDAARYPGDIGSMRWRPELVSGEEPPGLQHVDDAPEGLTYRPGALADPLGLPLTGTVLRHADRPVYRLRLDDGHRYVARDLDDAALALDPAGLEALARRTWKALERELTDARHVEAAPAAAAIANPVLLWYDATPPEREARAILDSVRVRMRTAMVRGEVYVAPADAGWRSVGYVDDDGLRFTSRPTWHQTALVGLTFRPKLRWCLACDRAHLAPGEDESLQVCSCCGAALPAVRYGVARHMGPQEDYELTLRCEGYERRHVVRRPESPRAFVVAFEGMEGAVVREIRRERGIRDRCPDAVPTSEAAHEAVQAQMHVHWAFSWTPTIEALRRWARGERQEPTQAPEEPAMAAEIRRRRERSGHTGPLPQRRRAPRRIDPGGGRL